MNGIYNMNRHIFAPADILLPEGIALENWSVIACDQFSSEPDYWGRVRSKVGRAPSTLNLIIPEAYLGEIDEEQGIKNISEAMEYYIDRDLFREIEDSFIYVERILPGGLIRRGLVGTVDLEEYDFSGGEASILASEGTVLDRLPTRVRVRRSARLELPHIIAFIDDKDMTVIEPLSEKAGSLQLLYDFDLMEGGGHIRGMRVHGADAVEIKAAMRALHGKSSTLMVMGDGNHSLAAAKVYWDELKQGMSATERENHPASKALVEVNNVYDPAISFEAIHRVLYDVDVAGFIRALESAVPIGGDYELRWVSKGQSGAIGVSAGCIGDMLAAVQEFLDDYVSENGCGIDYIHGADTIMRIAGGERCMGLVLPAMDKSELFTTVARRGVFPKKSFSVGHARDKRYYLECRSIKAP